MVSRQAPNGLDLASPALTAALGFAREVLELSVADRNFLGKLNAPVPARVLGTRRGDPLPWPSKASRNQPRCQGQGQGQGLKGWLSARRQWERANPRAAWGSFAAAADPLLAVNPQAVNPQARGGTTERHASRGEVLEAGLPPGTNLRPVRVVTGGGEIRDELQPWAPWPPPPEEAAHEAAAPEAALEAAPEAAPRAQPGAPPNPNDSAAGPAGAGLAGACPAAFGGSGLVAGTEGGEGLSAGSSEVAPAGGGLPAPVSAPVSLVLSTCFVPLCYRCKAYIRSRSHVAWRAHKFRALFCDGECFRIFLQHTTASGLRRACGEQDAGQCRACGLDCFRLTGELKDLLALSQEGRQIVRAHLDKTKRYGGKALSERHERILEGLVQGGSSGLAGRVWQADHITEVWDGGGLATAAGNCQVLCAFCHADKTAKEGARRREQRRLSAAGRRQRRFEEILASVPWLDQDAWRAAGLRPIGIPESAGACKWRRCGGCLEEDMPHAPRKRKCVACEVGSAWAGSFAGLGTTARAGQQKGSAADSAAGPRALGSRRAEPPAKKKVSRPTQDSWLDSSSDDDSPGNSDGGGDIDGAGGIGRVDGGQGGGQGMFASGSGGAGGEKSADDSADGSDDSLDMIMKRPVTRVLDSFSASDLPLSSTPLTPPLDPNLGPPKTAPLPEISSPAPAAAPAATVSAVGAFEAVSFQAGSPALTDLQTGAGSRGDAEREGGGGGGRDDDGTEVPESTSKSTGRGGAGHGADINGRKRRYRSIFSASSSEEETSEACGEENIGGSAEGRDGGTNDSERPSDCAPAESYPD